MEFTGATSTRGENPRQPVLGIGGRVAVNPHNPHPNTANPGALGLCLPPRYDDSVCSCGFSPWAGGSFPGFESLQEVRGQGVLSIDIALTLEFTVR